MISPCRSCSLEYVDKNNDTCMRCAKRIKYCEALAGLTCSVPVEMTDMAITNISKEKVREHDEFIMANPRLKAHEIAKQLGRSTAAIYSRRHALGLTKRQRDMASAPTDRQSVADSPASPAHGLTLAEVTPAADLVLINVKGHEELYERLKRSAQANFRTPELQALYFIHNGLAAEGGAGDQRRAPDGAA